MPPTQSFGFNACGLVQEPDDSSCQRRSAATSALQDGRSGSIRRPGAGDRSIRTKPTAASVSRISAAGTRRRSLRARKDIHEAAVRIT